MPTKGKQSKTSQAFFAPSAEEGALSLTKHADRSLIGRRSKGKIVRGGEEFHTFRSGGAGVDTVSVLPSGHRGLGVSDRIGRTENTCKDVMEALLTGCPILELDVRRAEKVLKPEQIHIRSLKNNELIICHTTPTEHFTATHSNITPLLQVPTLREVVETVANVYCDSLSHWKKAPPILQLELKGVERDELEQLAKDCLITIISALNEIKVARGKVKDAPMPLLAVDLLVTGNTESGSLAKTGSEELSTMLGILIKNVEVKVVGLPPDELYGLFRAYITKDKGKQRVESRGLTLSKAEFDNGLSCISHVGITGCIDTALAVGPDGIDRVPRGLDLFNVVPEAKTSKDAITRAKKYFDSGIGVDIGLFDVDEEFIHLSSQKVVITWSTKSSFMSTFGYEPLHLLLKGITRCNARNSLNSIF